MYLWDYKVSQPTTTTPSSSMPYKPEILHIWTFSNSPPLQMKAGIPCMIPKVNNTLREVTTVTKNQKVPARLLKRECDVGKRLWMVRHHSLWIYSWGCYGQQREVSKRAVYWTQITWNVFKYGTPKTGYPARNPCLLTITVIILYHSTLNNIKINQPIIIKNKWHHASLSVSYKNAFHVNWYDSIVSKCKQF